MTLEELKVIVTAETAGYEKGMQQVKQLTAATTSGIQNAFKGIGNSIGKYISVAAIVAGLLKIGKASVEAASDLAEVQNVVDVTFGQSANTINKWSKNLISSFGLSELSAKLFSGTMGAMLKSSGIADSDITEMSMQLTELTADMASFYNLDAETAFQKIRSGISGETEPLKQLGINLSVATLEEYALSQGITKSFNSMTLSEKVLLRYNYLLKATADSHGDFARTSSSWANQVKLLNEQWSKLTTQLGEKLIQALTPLVQLMNLFLSSIIQVSNYLSELFGGTTSSSSLTVIKSTAAAAGAISEGIEDAAEASKELKKNLTSIDELNVIDLSNGSGSGSGTGGTSTFEVASNRDINQAESKLDGLAQKILWFYDTVKSTFEKWFNDMPKLELGIDWAKLEQNLKTISEYIINIVAAVSSLMAYLGISVLNDLNLGLLLNDVAELASLVSGLVSDIVDDLVPAFKDMYDKYISPIISWLGEKGHLWLQNLNDVIVRLKDFWAQHGESIISVIDAAVAFASGVAQLVQPMLDLIYAIGEMGIDVLVDTLLTVVGLIVDVIAALNGDIGWDKVWADVKVNVGRLGEDIATDFIDYVEQETIEGGTAARDAENEGYKTGVKKNIEALNDPNNSFWTNYGEYENSSAYRDEHYLAYGGGLQESYDYAKDSEYWIKRTEAYEKYLALYEHEKEIAIQIAKNTLGDEPVALYKAYQHTLLNLVSTTEDAKKKQDAYFKAGNIGAAEAGDALYEFGQTGGEVITSQGGLFDWLGDVWDDFCGLFTTGNDTNTSSVTSATEQQASAWSTFTNATGLSLTAYADDLTKADQQTFYYADGTKVKTTQASDAWKKSTESITTDVTKMNTDVSKETKTMSNNMDGSVTTTTSKTQNAFLSMRVNLENTFKLLKNNLKTPINGIIGFINSMVKAAVDGLNTMIRAINSISFEIPDSKIFGSYAGETVGFDLSEITYTSIPYLAKGGIVNSGQLFMANENGPELVGRYGNQTGVMNNDQIVSAVSTGVFNAMMEAMKNGSQAVNVFLDGKQIEASVRGTALSRGAIIANGGVLNYAY